MYRMNKFAKQMFAEDSLSTCRIWVRLVHLLLLFPYLTPRDFHYQSIGQQLDNKLPRTFFHSNQELNCFPTWDSTRVSRMCRKWILTWIDVEFGEFAAVWIEYAVTIFEVLPFMEEPAFSTVLHFLHSYYFTHIMNHFVSIWVITYKSND